MPVEFSTSPVHYNCDAVIDKYNKLSASVNNSDGGFINDHRRQATQDTCGIVPAKKNYSAVPNYYERGVVIGRKNYTPMVLAH